jgi:uncharacterized membrane protein
MDYKFLFRSEEHIWIGILFQLFIFMRSSIKDSTKDLSLELRQILEKILLRIIHFILRASIIEFKPDLSFEFSNIYD